MPTGYTAILQDKNLTLKAFAVHCSSAIGYSREAYDETTNTFKLVKVNLA